MLSIFKKFFGKTERKAAAAAQPTAVAAPPSTPMPTIEVAHLSLAAIVARFPDELKPLLMREPDAAATVALPMPTILKQLPTGSVKMSLASLHRQAHGLIRPLPPGDKRAVEVPLAEVFRHVRPEVFRRRADQRVADIPDNGFNLFGDASNPYAISPDDHITNDLVSIPEPTVLDLSEELPEAPAAPKMPTPSGVQRVLKMDAGLRAEFANGNLEPHVESHEEQAAPAPLEIDLEEIAPAPSLRMEAPTSTPLPAPTPTPLPAPASTPLPAPVATPLPAPVRAATPERHVAPVAPSAPAPAREIPVPQPPLGPTISLPLAALSANWPEDLRSEIAALDPATQVALPLADVTGGMAKGRVTFSWKQIQSWLQPAATAPSAVAGDSALLLPLKVVAPVFLAATRKPAAERQTATVDENIPALFSDGRPPAPAAPVEETPAAPEPTPAEPLAEATVVEAELSPVPAAPTHDNPETVGQAFGQPHKESWTPAELVTEIVKLPGVAGAIVALQEGLPVAACLPDGVKGEVVAAFLPQIFARLNQYAGEMRLGDVDDLLFTTHGAHCQIYRLGYIYFAVLGKAGEALPWHELHLVTEELARQTHK